MKNQATAQEILRKYWGYDSFRPPQLEIISSTLDGKDNFVLLPTGGGKSLCYQIPALLMDGLCLVVSPLVALMQDQVSNLMSKGIQARALHAAMDKQEIESVLERAKHGDIDLLYVSPERLQSPLFLTYLEALEVALIAVDEAHCISQWGYDFRPSYLQISKIRKLCSAPIIALTGSAEPKVVEDIIEKLEFNDGYLRFEKSFVRPNICYRVYEVEHKMQVISEQYRKGFSSIIYCATRGMTEKVSHRMKQKGIPCDYYHAGLDAKSRQRKQTHWIQEKPPLMSSTNAFGMGIDKPNVRQVFHINPPLSPEAYYQEAGRAGRDQEFSTATLFFDGSDLYRMQEIQKKKFFDKAEAEKIYAHVFNFLQLAQGTGTDTLYDFDFIQFVQNFNLNMTKTLFFFRYFQQEGFWIFEENQWDTRPRVKVLAEPSVMEELQVMGKHTEKRVLESLFRLHQNIRFDYSRIVLMHLSDLAQLPRKAVEDGLRFLASNGMIDFIEGQKKQSLYLLKNRLPAGELHYDQERLKQLKKNEEERINKMIRYLKNTEICRQKMLVSFFGEKAEDCKICDVCQRKKVGPINKNLLITFVRNHPSSSLEDLRQKFFAEKQNEFNKWMQMGEKLNWWEINTLGEITLKKK